MSYTAHKEILSPLGLEEIHLTAPGHQVRILSGRGFNLYAWRYRGRDLLMPFGDYEAPGAAYGIPLLFPTPNRLENAEYTWRGVTRKQRKRGRVVAIHGLVIDEPWTARCWAEADAAIAEGTIVIDEASPLYEAYPFPMTVTVRYTLGPGGLRLDFSARNEGREDAPFGFGIHPYFAKGAQGERVALTMPLHRVYENDERVMPTGRILSVRGTDLDISGSFHEIDSLRLDQAYRGMTEDHSARIRLPEGECLTLRGSDAFRNLIVYVPDHLPGFCVEHQTCSTNAFGLHNRGLIDEAGLLCLPPDQTFSCWITLMTGSLGED